MTGVILPNYLSPLSREDADDSSVSLTVVVSGSVITGAAVSREYWFENLRDSMSSAGISSEWIDSFIAASDAETLASHIDDEQGQQYVRDLADTELHMINALIDGNYVGPVIVNRDSISAWSPSGRKVE